MRPTLLPRALLVAAVVSGTPAARAQEPKPLAAGMKEERTLGPGETHAYVVTLQEGEAVVGEADQHGVDLVIDVHGPDGRLIRTLDSPNGMEGPEPIELTAFRAGRYELDVHTLDAAATPGRYVMRIDRVLAVEENGQRLAEKDYSRALQGLWRAYRADPQAIDELIASRKGKGPVVEDVEGDSKNVSVTYLYLGDENTEKVTVFEGTHGSTGGLGMERFLRTPLFFATELVPRDARFTYQFVVTEARLVGPDGSIRASYELPVRIDPLNPEVFDGRSALAMPSAPPQPDMVRDDSVPQGKVSAASLESRTLKEHRPLSVYTPPGHESGAASDLLIVLDGEDYDGGSSSSVPVPTILDNLIAARKIPPTIAVFVKNVGHRVQDLADSPAFADFIGKEVVPWVRKSDRVEAGARHVVVAGGSLGGLAASYCAVRHPEVIGNVLSLSGSFWITKDWQDRPPFPLTLAGETGDLIGDLRKGRRMPLAFYVAIGRFEVGAAMLGTNRELRDVLLLKGYPVTYREVAGEHDNIWWRGSLADGLVALLGQERR